MKFTTTSKLLANALSVIAPTVGKGKVLPIVACVHVIVAGNVVKLSTTNLSASLSYEMIDTKVEKEGTMAIPFEKFKEIISTLGDQEVTIKELAGLKVEIKYSNGKSTLACIDALDYPKIPEIVSSKWFPISGPQFSAMAKHLSKISSNDEGRPTLTCLSLEFKDNMLHMAATDGFRLSNGTIAKEYPDTSILVPADMLAALITKIPNHEVIDIAIDGNMFGASAGNVTGYVLLMQGTFPDWRSIVPKKFDTLVRIDDIVQFRTALKQADIFAGENHRVILDASDGKMVITAEGEEIGNTKSIMDCVFMQGTEMRISLNTIFLEQAIEPFAGIDNKFIIGFNKANTPLGITPIDGTKNTYRSVLMPLHVDDKASEVKRTAEVVAKSKQSDDDGMPI